MSGHDPEQGTYRGLRLEPAGRADRRPSRRATAWLVAGVLLLVLAALAGLATAYIVAGMRAAPSPNAAFLPTATPSLTPVASADGSASPTATAGGVGSPTAPPTLTASPEPTPEATPFEYVVQRGDSVTKIAARFGVTPESIIELNELRNPNLIVPGQVLLIPGAPNLPTPSPTA